MVLRFFLSGFAVDNKCIDHFNGTTALAGVYFEELYARFNNISAIGGNGGGHEPERAAAVQVAQVE